MNPVLAIATAAIPALVASTVEFVEAFTIVLAVGTTRGWRAPIWGTIAAALTLAVIVGMFGAPLLTYHEQVSQYFHLVVGVVLLLFSMRWLHRVWLTRSYVAGDVRQRQVCLRLLASTPGSASSFLRISHRSVVLTSG
jgi:uncharacterized membrane protein